MNRTILFTLVFAVASTSPALAAGKSASPIPTTAGPTIPVSLEPCAPRDPTCADADRPVGSDPDARQQAGEAADDA